MVGLQWPSVAPYGFAVQDMANFDHSMITEHPLEQELRTPISAFQVANQPLGLTSRTTVNRHHTLSLNYCNEDIDPERRKFVLPLATMAVKTLDTHSQSHSFLMVYVESTTDSCQKRNSILFCSHAPAGVLKKVVSVLFYL